MKHLWVFISLCISLTSERALANDVGPAFFNATDGAVSVEITFSAGSGFSGDLGADGLMGWPFPWQVRTMKVHMKRGGNLAVSEAQVTRLRGKLTKPGNQLWVIDTSHVCVLDSRRFKAVKGVRCPAPAR